MLAFLYYWLTAFIWLLWCCFLDYGLYVCVDFMARHWLKVARNDSERNRIWRLMCLFLLKISIPVFIYHHTPGLLWTLIIITLLLTVRTYIKFEYDAFKSLGTKILRFVKNSYRWFMEPRRSVKNLNRPNVALSPIIENYRIGYQYTQPVVPIAQNPNYRTQNGPSQLTNVLKNNVKTVENEVDNAVIVDSFRNSSSPTHRFLRKPLRPTSFESSGYGSPPVVSTPLTDTPPIFGRNTSPSSKFATSTPVDPWQIQRDTYRLGY